MAQTESLFDVPVPRKHRKTRETSIASYAVARERLKGREADVLRWLAAFWNVYQHSPTSAELSKYAMQRIAEDSNLRGDAEWLLFTRRGISDLQTHGLVEASGKRQCRVTGSSCMTWRVVQR